MYTHISLKIVVLIIELISDQMHMFGWKFIGKIAFDIVKA